MRTLYFECSMGAAGDMIAASLIELMEEPEAFLKKLNSIGLAGVEYRLDKESRNHIYGTRLHVEVNGVEEGHEHDQSCHHHDHEGCDHDHEHHHHHTTLADIEDIVESLAISDASKNSIMAVYEEIARAEAKVHHTHLHDIHFHEVGTMDAIADIAASVLLIEALKPDQILASAVRTGYGSVRCAHGLLPVPAPAAAELLKGIPVYAGDIEGEMCTPTGAAILRHYVKKFEPMPEMSIEKIGYGLGSREFERANILRAFIGETQESCLDVCLMECNLDDMTGEDAGFALEQLMETGALDVWTTPVGMKKSRPGIKLSVLCYPDQAEEMASQIFKYTTTIGIRYSVMKRYALTRNFEVLQTPYGEIVKKTCTGFGVEKTKLEYEDLHDMAKQAGISISELKNSLKGL